MYSEDDFIQIARSGRTFILECPQSDRQECLSHPAGLVRSHMFTEDDFIQISALQHYVFCPRQCGLIQGS